MEGYSKQNEAVRMSEGASVGVVVDPKDAVRWHCHTKVEKYEGDWTPEQIAAGEAAPYEVKEVDGNLLVTVGATILWNLLIGAGGTVFSNANAYLGVGDSSTAADVAQTDLQAVTNKLRKAMDSTYPQVSTNTCVFKATFGTSEANWAWAEWATFNASTAGTMLQRKVESLGTKTTGTWVLTVTLSLA